MVGQNFEMSFDPRAIANLILDYAESRSFRITQLSLQKILYFCHGWYLAKHDKPLINEPVEAWKRGPVYRSVYRCFKECGESAIKSRATKINFSTGEPEVVRQEIESEAQEFVKNIFDAYSRYSAVQLVLMSHEKGGPWDQIWNGSREVPVPGMQIPDEITAQWFRTTSLGLTKQ